MLRWRRLGGQMLKQLPDARGGDRKSLRSKDQNRHNGGFDRPTYADLGIEEHVGRRWKALDEIEEWEFERYIEQAKAVDGGAGRRSDTHMETNTTPNSRASKRRRHGQGSIYPMRDKTGQATRYGAAVSLGYAGGKRLRRVITGRNPQELQLKLDALAQLKQAVEFAFRVGILPHDRDWIAWLFDPDVAVKDSRPASDIPPTMTSDHTHQQAGRSGRAGRPKIDEAIKREQARKIRRLRARNTPWEKISEDLKISVDTAQRRVSWASHKNSSRNN